MKQQVDWERLYQERARRLKTMLDKNAPKVIVYMAAEVLLKTEYQNSSLRMFWAWFKKRIRQQFGFWRSDIGVWRLRLAGWPRHCAVDIYFGDPPEDHKKNGCKCGKEWDEMLDLIRGKQ